MNWDISIGYLRQWYGRSLRAIGSRIGNRKLMLAGERSQFAGRLQARYGALKHHTQWSWVFARMRPRVAARHPGEFGREYVPVDETNG